MILAIGSWRAVVATGLLAAALAVSGPQNAYAEYFDLGGVEGGDTRTIHVQNTAFISLKVQVRYLSCSTPAQERQLDKSWRTASSALLYPKSVKIRFASSCTVKLELSCNGCHGRGQVETHGGNLFVKGSAFKWGISKHSNGVTQIGNNLATCTSGPADLHC